MILWYRNFLARLVHLMLRCHYSVTMQGREVFDGKRPILLLPNHTAYVDPLLLCSEIYDVPVCPMVDERFMRHPLLKHTMRWIGAVEVPDLMAESKEESLKSKAAAASQLTRIALDTLREGRSLIFYPSGHIKTVDREVIGNRRLAYEVCRDLPENTTVVLCRMRGLEESRWSKLKTTTHTLRRPVNFYFEDRTADLRRWAQTMERRQFNEQLENWYNDVTPAAE